MTVSALYEGWVHHRRFADVDHEFRYRVAMAYLDLGELPGALDHRPLASARGPALARFRRADHLGDPDVPLDVAVRDHVQAEGGARPLGPIRVLTTLRSFGVGFNPVRFYYCFTPAEDGLEAVVAEVTNTPWGESHAYVLRAGGNGSGALRGEMPKRMHVSPFLGMDHTYAWRLTEPGRELVVHLENREDGQRAFDATLRMHCRPLNRRTLSETLLRHPPQTLRVLAGIYGQAARLKLKGAPYHPHPKAVSGCPRAPS